MTDILYVLNHRPDNRYIKRFNLFSHVYSQAVVYWNKDQVDSNLDLPIESKAIHVPANQTNPTKRIPETLLFSRKAALQIEQDAPRCLYVGNLDMLRIAVSYKKKHPNVKIVYEVADLHRLIVDRQRGPKRMLQTLLVKMEKAYMGYVDLLVVTSLKFIDVYYRSLIPQSKTVYMPNLPEASTFADYVPGRRHEVFTIGYFGWIRYIRQLENLLEAVQTLDCRIIIAGSDNSGSEFKERCESLKNVEYLGPFEYSRDIVTLYDEVDCVYSVYDAGMFNVRVALPNKLYESILARKPIIVANNTYLSELVESMGVGISVTHDDVSDIRKGIMQLMDAANYDSCVQSCANNREVSLPDDYNEFFLNKMEYLFFNRGGY